MRKLLLIPALFLTVACSHQEKNDEPKPNKGNETVMKPLSGLTFQTGTPILVSASDPDLLKLKASSEYQASFDPGNDTAWYKIPNNMNGVVLFITRSTKLLGNDFGCITWTMDTLNSTSGNTIMGTVYLYSANTSTNGSYSGKEYIYAPIDDVNYIAYYDVNNGLRVNETQNPDLPNFPNLRPWKDKAECMEYTLCFYNNHPATMTGPTVLAANIYCFFAIKFGWDAVDCNGKLLPEIPKTK